MKLETKLYLTQLAVQGVLSFYLRLRNSEELEIDLRLIISIGLKSFSEST